MRQWGRRYQEEELSSLRSELDKVLREVEAETKLLGDREEVIRGIREEQRQVCECCISCAASILPMNVSLLHLLSSLIPSGLSAKRGCSRAVSRHHSSHQVISRTNSRLP